MLPCNQKIGVYFYHLVLWGHLLLLLFLMGLSTRCLTPLKMARNLHFAFNYFFSLHWWYWWHIEDFHFLEIYTICPFCKWIKLILWTFLVSYDQFVASILLHIWALICLHNVINNIISLLYFRLFSLPNMFWYFNNTFYWTYQMICVLPSNMAN